MTTTICPSTRTPLAALIALVTALSAGACSSDNSPTSPSTPNGGTTSTTTGGSSGTSTPTSSSAGRYTLVSVNGIGVPGVFERWDLSGLIMEMEALSGFVVLGTDGRYQLEARTRLSNSRSEPTLTTTQASGTYNVSGSTLALAPQGGTPYNAKIESQQITITSTAPGLDGQLDTSVWVYRK